MRHVDRRGDFSPPSSFGVTGTHCLEAAPHPDSSSTCHQVPVLVSSLRPNLLPTPNSSPDERNWRRSQQTLLLSIPVSGDDILPPGLRSPCSQPPPPLSLTPKSTLPLGLASPISSMKTPQPGGSQCAPTSPWALARGLLVRLVLCLFHVSPCRPHPQVVRTKGRSHAVFLSSAPLTISYVGLLMNCSLNHHTSTLGA